MRRATQGATLVELMIAMVLGLLLLGTCAYFYIASLSSTRSTIAVSRLQESGRMAMELIGRDIRGAGDLLCDVGHAVDILLAERSRPFWVSFAEPVRGQSGGAGYRFEDPPLPLGTGVGQQLPGTVALRLWTVRPMGTSLLETVASNKPLPLTSGQSEDNPIAGQALLACDFTMAALMRVTSATGGLTTQRSEIGHATPENCVDNFAPPDSCSQPLPVDPSLSHRFHAGLTAFGAPRQIRWFVSNDENGVPSLYRQELIDGAVATGGILLQGVTVFELDYLLHNASTYIQAESVSDDQWRNVRSVRVRLSLNNAAGTASEHEISREFNQTFSIRARVL